MPALKSLTLILTISLFSVVSIAELSPETVAGAKSVDGKQAKMLFNSGALFVDTRSNSDWEAGRIPSAVHLELKAVYSEATLSAEATKNEAIVIYCNGTSCLRSAAATAKAVEWGFTNLYYYRLGYPDWKSHRYPTE